MDGIMVTWPGQNDFAASISLSPDGKG